MPHHMNRPPSFLVSCLGREEQHRIGLAVVSRAHSCSILAVTNLEFDRKNLRPWQR